MHRRQLLTLASSAALAGGALGLGLGRLTPAAQAQQPTGPFSLPPLGYAYEALEPHIDATTMRIHHSAHHKAFIDNLNRVADKLGDIPARPIEQTLANLADVPEAMRTVVRNSGGGHWNHTFFWSLMIPGGAKEPAGDLQAAINGAFGDQSKMIEAFTAAAVGRFGSGWAWLAVGRDKKLTITSTPNQDTPHMEGARGAVLGIDVWEHAYYLKYQNRRAEYVKTWWNTVNWDTAAASFKQLTA
jgi:superoxide dismutase, Fe-Mn family